MQNKSIISIGLFIMLLFVGTGTTVAQLRFGVKGGIDVIDHRIDIDMLKVSNRLGYQVGATMEFMSPGVGLGAELSVLYGRKEYKIEDKQVNANISDYDYISIPLVLKKRFGLTSLLGVYISGGAFANVKIDGGDFSLSDTVDKYKSKEFEAGVLASAGLRLLNNFDLGLYYRATLTERYSADHPDIKKIDDKHFQTWTVGLTYFF